MRLSIFHWHPNSINTFESQAETLKNWRKHKKKKILCFYIKIYPSNPIPFTHKAFKMLSHIIQDLVKLYFQDWLRWSLRNRRLLKASTALLTQWKESKNKNKSKSWENEEGMTWGKFQVEERREGREPTLKWWAVLSLPALVQGLQHQHPPLLLRAMSFPLPCPHAPPLLVSTCDTAF